MLESALELHQNNSRIQMDILKKESENVERIRQRSPSIDKHLRKAQQKAEKIIGKHE